MLAEFLQGYLRNIRIGAKIFSGFCVLLLLLFCIVLLTNYNTKTFRSAFDQQLSQSSEVEEIFEIDRRVSDLQKYILIYSHTGQLAAIDQAKSIDEQLIIDIKSLADRTAGASLGQIMGSPQTIGERQHLIDGMLTIIQNLPKQIDELVRERQRSVMLVNNELSLSVENIEEVINSMLLESSASEDLEFVSWLTNFERRFIKLQRQILIFFHTRQFDLLESINLTISDLKSEVKNKNTVSPDVKLDDLFKYYSEHEDIFYRAVQANRGYLFLVNVVLAGETSEFLQLSSRLRTLSFDSLLRTSKKSLNLIEKTQFFAYIGSITAIFLGIVLAFLIGGSIAKPLSKITVALQDLAHGNSDTQIPSLNRGDEIGQIARAADVFKETNIKTEALLEKTQSLASDILTREKMLEAKTRELEKSNQDLDNFAYVASHDLKSPLRGIDNLAAWIAEDCEAVLPPESARHLVTLRSRIRRMENLLVDLLQYSRAGKVEELIEEVDLNGLVSSTYDLIDKPEDCQLIILRSLPTLTTQKSPLQQVFLNLFTNAIKYSDKKCPRIEIGVSETDDGFYEFSVADNGPGIEEIYHEKVFQMFQTLQARDVVESSGMGLSIVRRVIESVGGEINLESRPGNGATFRFTWPIKMVTSV